MKAIVALGLAAAALVPAPVRKATADPLQSPVAAVQAAPKPEGTATIKGSVKFKGVIPKRRKIATDAEPKCSALHASDPLLSDDAVIDATGNLQWAVVLVKEGLGDRKFDPPKTPVVLEQKACRFEPHVLGIMAGQDLLIRNHDELVH
ncbi:MAG TPA: hypothetical protein VEN81_14025, partial [Planctomycetota bacterium]|nr:hypothetical protein [Planctomycetota bacterium]